MWEVILKSLTDLSTFVEIFCLLKYCPHSFLFHFWKKFEKSGFYGIFLLFIDWKIKISKNKPVLPWKLSGESSWKIILSELKYSKSLSIKNATKDFLFYIDFTYFPMFHNIH